MKTDYTHISIVLDRSGSMAELASDTIGGFNRFLEDQQKAPGEATLTLVQFDHEYEVLYSCIPIKVIPPLNPDTFIPRGSTALFDAIGRGILETGEHLSALSEEQRPARVIFVIYTDGLENASKLYTSPRIREMIAHQEKVYKWDFLFMGSNQDAIKNGAEIQIPMRGSLNVNATGQGTRSAFAALSRNTVRVRDEMARGLSGVSGQSMGWSKQDREEQNEADTGD